MTNIVGRVSHLEAAAGVRADPHYVVCITAERGETMDAAIERYPCRTPGGAGLCQVHRAHNRVSREVGP
jgi:hypothetical protein